ncbi:KV3AK protein, partial [Rhynochetos jubatus]|nr:KV3AK protein [Rhynochetos jubatus]
AQVLLKQYPPSITKGRTKTAWIDCRVEGVSGFQSAPIHWYRHLPSKDPERILYITSGAPSYDDSSYRSKYGALKRDTNVCTLQVYDIRSRDEGTYYCAY